MDKINEVNSFFSIEKFLTANPFLRRLSINDYPVLMIVWNLLLLAVPFFLFVLLESYWRDNKFKNLKEKIIASCLFFLWLIFIPNTVYIITTVRHLLNYCPAGSYNPFIDVCPANVWMIIFFFIYASLGWIFFVLFLRQMKDFLKKVFNKNIACLFIAIVIPLISLGVLLGLINRFNSWDAFLHPLAILKTMLIYITDVHYFGNFLVFTLGLYALYFAGEFLFKRGEK